MMGGSDTYCTCPQHGLPRPLTEIVRFLLCFLFFRYVQLNGMTGQYTTGEGQTEILELEFAGLAMTDKICEMLYVYISKMSCIKVQMLNPVNIPY